MKTKQPYMKAVMPQTSVSNARNYGGEKEQIRGIKLIDKKTERVIVDARWYMGRSTSASAVYCSLWCMGRGVYESAHSTSGKGTACGYGYHKASAALASAITSAGITLYGSPYGHPVNQDSDKVTKALLKSVAHIGGGGDVSIECALLSIAYAMGYRDVIKATL
jgi:hypothetical protein